MGSVLSVSSFTLFSYSWDDFSGKRAEEFEEELDTYDKFAIYKYLLMSLLFSDYHITRINFFSFEFNFRNCVLCHRYLSNYQESPDC